jgi:parallel beta-helix repeat protein
MEPIVSKVLKAARVARLVLMASALCVAAAATGHAACKTITTLTPTACGVVISTPGCYVINNDLTASSDSGDCIEITAPDVYLNLSDGESITGTGASSTGNGIHVTSTAAGATIVNGFVSSFNIGILAEARVRLEGPLVELSNADGIQLSNAPGSKILGAIAIENGSSAGIEIDGSNGCSLTNVAASDNPTGVLVSGSSGTDISNATNISSNEIWGILVTQANSAPFAPSNGTIISGSYIYSNGHDGIWLLGSKANKVFANQIYGNGRVGVWLDASSGNEVGGNTLYDNGTADVFLGCFDTGPIAPEGCSNRSTANDIDYNNSNGKGDSSYGIAFDLGDTSNTILDNTSSMHTTEDMYDANSKTANTWFANTFTTANQSFIH